MKDSADIRKVNLHKIRSILWKGDWFTKQQISELSGLSVATCNNLLNDLSDSGEVISRKIRLHDVGPTALEYKINEEYESILCLWIEGYPNVNIVNARVLSTVGNVLDSLKQEYDSIDEDVLYSTVDAILKRYTNVSSIMVGVPAVADKGIISHCDIENLNGFKLVEEFTKRYSKKVYMENDMPYKAFGYYKKLDDADKVITVVFFPKRVLPGSATVHKGMIIKGKDHFAGMIGFLPFDKSQKELLDSLKDDSSLEIITKSVISLIAIQNPSVIVLSGELVNEEVITKVKEDTLKVIPEEYMPEIIYQKDMMDYYVEGMYQKALELKGVF